MLDWPGAGRGERRMLEVLNLIFVNNYDVLLWIFDPSRPRLIHDAASILDTAEELPPDSRALIRLAVALWCGELAVSLWEIIELQDEQTYHDVLAGLGHLRKIDPDGPEYRFRQLKFPSRASSPTKNPVPRRGVCRR